MIGEILSSDLKLQEKLIDGISNNDILFNSELSDQFWTWKLI